MYLMIRNPGVADWRGFVTLGISTSRFEGTDDTIGEYGSGAKLATITCLRHQVPVIIIAGNLRMEYSTQPETVGNSTFNRIIVAFSGKDEAGTSRNHSRPLDMALEWGTKDWKSPKMGLREFVANALDGALAAGKDHSSVEIAVVDKPRAKAGHTSVFLGYTPAVQEAHQFLGTMFLHFNKRHLLAQKFLPRLKQESGCFLVYKKGVLAAAVKGDSAFDYNFGDELVQDESRNSSEWDVKNAAASTWKDAPADRLAELLTALSKNHNLWEAGLYASDVRSDYDLAGARERRCAAFQTAWKSVAGTKGVATSGNPVIDSFIKDKGHTPLPLPRNWVTILEGYGIPSEKSVLTKVERDGKQVLPPTPEMKAAVAWAWGLLESFGLTNKKTMPTVCGFQQIMEGATQLWGQYDKGVVYLHKELGGDLLKKAALEEVVHHITGAGDGSRDIQDFLFRTIVAIAA